MTKTMVGADADELERVARDLRATADDLEAQANALTATLRSVAWVGGVATRFGGAWDGGHRPRVHATSQYVRDAATRLDRHAAEQRDASRGGREAPSGGPPPPGGPSPDGSDVLDRLDRTFEIVGAGRDALDTVLAGAEALADVGVAHKLIDLLTSDEVRFFLEGFDAVIDAQSVVVDLVTDFMEHPDLPFDERLVHAFADAALRFGVEQGMELAAEWLAGAATTALLPGFGAVLAPIVGQIAGAVAGTVMDVAVDAIDASTDIIDTIADAAVGRYRDVKAVFGVIGDVAQAAGDVVAGAVDLAGDVGGAIVDAGGAVIDVGGDILGGIGGVFGG